MLNFDGAETEQYMIVIRVPYSNYSKWGNQPNHYDLLHSHVEVTRERTKFHEIEGDKTDYEERKEKLDKSLKGPKLGGSEHKEE
eukprot:6969677-Heterocapsa_arctica.AAC.1